MRHVTDRHDAVGGGHQATQEQVKSLWDAVESQNAQIQQIHASVQLILQKLSS
jgi:hypothetical protein